MKLTIYTVTQVYDGEATVEAFTDHEAARKAMHDHYSIDFESVFGSREFPAYDAEDVGPQMQEFFDKRDETGGTWNYVKLEEHEVDLPSLKIKITDWDTEHDTQPIDATLAIFPDKLQLGVNEGPEGENRIVEIEQSESVIKVRTYGGDKDEPTSIVMEPSKAPRFEMEG